MTELLTHARAKQATLSAVVIRADGRREDLGVIGYWHKNPLMRWAFRIRRALGI
jgi:hypothetical protein